MPVDRSDPTAGLPEDLADLDVIVVRDPVYSGGGGISVVADVARFLEAPIYTLRQTEDVAAYEDLEVREIRPSYPWTSRFLRDRGLARLLTIPEMLAYQDWEPPRDADVVVTIGTRSQHVIHHPHQLRIHKFFTPARWLWDLSHEQWADRNRLVEWLMLSYASYARTLDVTSLSRFDEVVAGSDVVAERVRRYYDIDPHVAYCPVDTFEYEHGDSEGFFFMLNRIVPEKRVKLVIETFNELGLPLKIAGDADASAASYMRECEELADDNVEFLGWVDGEEKQQLLSGAEALIFAAKEEDFGMPPVEAMAAGKPIVGVNEGFTRHQVETGRNGVSFAPTVDSLKEAVETCLSTDWDATAIQEDARDYDVRAVRGQWVDIVRRSLSDTAEQWD